MTDNSQPVPENITGGKWDPETWKSKPAVEAIHALFAYVDNEASKAVAWYENAKGKKASLSRWLRGGRSCFLFSAAWPRSPRELSATEPPTRRWYSSPNPVI